MSNDGDAARVRGWGPALIVAAALVAPAAFAACNADETGTAGTTGTGGTGGSTGSSGTTTTTSTGIDCSLVGCAPPPSCDVGCTETCGCCLCSPGATETVNGTTRVCQPQGCWAPSDGGTGGGGGAGDGGAGGAGGAGVDGG